MGAVLLMLSGPSGVGKTTVAHRLLAKNINLSRVVTCTTRLPREGESDGVDYHFLEEKELMRFFVCLKIWLYMVYFWQ